MTEYQFGAGRRLDSEELGTSGHTALRADFDGSALTPDKGPPGAARNGTQDAAFLPLSAVPGLLGFHLKLAVNLVLVAMQAQVLDMEVGLINVRDLFTGKVSGQALLPEEVTAFDFALGLWGWSVTEADAIEVQGLAELSQGVRVMGEEEAVKIDIDFQGQSALDEGGRQKIQIGQEEFPFIDFRAGENAAAVIEHIDHRKELGAVGKPGVGRGIQLPEFPNAVALPTFNRSRRARVGFGVSQAVDYSPAADLSPVDLELTFAEHLAGGKAVRSWGLAAEALLQEGVHLGGPSLGVIAARNAGRPSGFLVMRTGRQVVSVKLVKTSSRKPQAPRGSLGLEFLGPERRQHMANQGGSTAMGQLPFLAFFIRRT